MVRGSILEMILPLSESEWQNLERIFDTDKHKTRTHTLVLLKRKFKAMTK